VDNKTIEENDYNIAVSTYVAQKDTREVIDIKKLNAEIKDIVALEFLIEIPRESKMGFYHQETGEVIAA
jgi:type I restriction-modification system DNA methylase subunit